MFVPCGPRSPWRTPAPIPPSPSPFLLPGSPNPLARSPGPPRGAFLHLSGSAPSLQSPRFRPPALSAGGTRPRTQTVAPGLLRIPPQPPPSPKKKAFGDSSKKKGLRGLLGALRSPPTAKMLQCWRSGPTRRTERSRGGRGKKGLLRDSACVLTCRRSGCSSETCLPACSFLFKKHSFFPAPPGPRPRGGM